MKIIVDADACPVTDIIFKESQAHDINVLLISSLAHYSKEELPSHAQKIYVDQGPDAADFKIIKHSQSGDLVISQDYGLAALLLEKGVTVLHHRGFFYHSNTIDRLLKDRHYMAIARKSGIRTKGPKALTDRDRTHFRHSLADFLNTELGESAPRQNF